MKTIHERDNSNIFYNIIYFLSFFLFIYVRYVFYLNKTFVSRKPLPVFRGKKTFVSTSIFTNGDVRQLKFERTYKMFFCPSPHKIEEGDILNFL